MAPKKVVKKVQNKYTMKDALNFIDKLNNPEGTKTIYRNSLINFMYWSKDLNNDVDYNNKTNNELKTDDKFLAYDLFEILDDVDLTIDTIQNKIRIKRTGEKLAIDSVKQIYSSIMSLNNKALGKLQLDAEKWKKYEDKVKEYNDLSNEKRRQNEASGNLKNAPHITWDFITDKYKTFLKEHIYNKNKFTAKKDLKNLRHAAVLGMYIYQLPRRLTDYYTLQYYSSKPSENDMEGRNILVLDMKTKTANIYIDKFKIRTMTRNNKTNEVLPRYETTLNDDLTQILTTYINAHGIKDMSKLTTEEKKKKAEYYVFYQELGINFNKYSNASSFSDHIKTASKNIIQHPLTPNDYRHSAQTEITNNLNEFTDKQLQKISIDVGDTPKDLATNLRYRIANPMNKGLNIQEINEMIDLKKQVLKPQEDGESVDLQSPEHNDEPSSDDVDKLVENFMSALKPLLYHILKK